MRLQPSSHRSQLARANGFNLGKVIKAVVLGPVAAIPVGAAARHANATSNLTKARSKYLMCKQKQLNKGKTPYPDDPKGPCKVSYKAWQKWRGKAGEAAIALAEKAEKKGTYDPALQDALQRDMASAMVENPGVVANAVVDENYDVSATAEEATSYMPYIVGGGVLLIGVPASILVIRSLLRR